MMASAHSALAPEELRAWTRLASTEAAPFRLNRLLKQCGSPGEIFRLSAQRLAELASCASASAERILDPAHDPGPDCAQHLARAGISLVPIHSPHYPSLLREIADPPPVLFARGQFPGASPPLITIVGTRNCDDYGRRTALRLAHELVEAGYCIVSGLALGTDTAAHRGAVEAGGATWAVLGSGPDVIYPAQNWTLAERILEQGALLSEYPPGTQPARWRFPARNRILSGLSRGTVVVQAPAGSGALITVQCAVEQNREVFAVPGPVDNPRSAGPHGLIRDGARLVQRAEDIIEELAPIGGLARAAPNQVHVSAGPEIPLDRTELQVLELLSSDPRHLDELVQDTRLSAATVSGAVVLLELAGRARRLPGNLYVRSDA